MTGHAGLAGLSLAVAEAEAERARLESSLASTGEQEASGGGAPDDQSPDADTAEMRAREASRAREDAEAAERRAAEEWSRCKEDLAAATARADHAQEEWDRVRTALERELAQCPDGQLAAEEQQCAEELQAAEAEVARLQAELHDPSVQRTRGRAAQVSTALKNIDRDLRATEGLIHQLQGRLDTAIRRQVQERVTQAEERLAEAQRTETALARRAAAAQRLVEVLTTYRDRARRGYAQPLETRVGELATAVVGDDTRVELDDSLRIAQRTLKGVTLPFERLSARALEQLALCVRLAAAQLVADQAGVPLVLDDALGYTDGQRLRGVAAVLRRAATWCQVIVLTCHPDRYRLLPIAPTEHLPQLRARATSFEPVAVGGGADGERPLRWRER